MSDRTVRITYLVGSVILFLSVILGVIILVTLGESDSPTLFGGILAGCITGGILMVAAIIGAGKGK